MSEFSYGSAAARGLARCKSCDFVTPSTERRCPRCRGPLHLRNPESLQRTWALIVTAVLFYFPANMLPILRVESRTNTDESSIIRGVIEFWQGKDYFVAAIIFTASITIPILKLLALAWLCIAARSGERPHLMTRLYRVTEVIGRWSMLDIFVVAIVVTLVQFSPNMSIHAGPATIPFALVVILTMMAAFSFDPRLIWDAAARLKDRA
jgi:paraquat-inducible protein A